jgi:hypothetical protein
MNMRRTQEDRGWRIEDSDTSRPTSCLSSTLHALFSILYLLSSILFFTASGCVAAGVAAHKIMGPAAIEAQYVPAKEPLVVMVENYRRPSSALTDDELLSRYIEGFLRGHEVAPLIESSKIRELRINRPDEFKKMSITAVGREVGAKQILYVDVVNSELESLMAGESLRGSTTVRVRVIDAETGQTRWPTDMADGYPLEQSLSFGKTTARSEQELKQSLYVSLGDRIAKLFYKWKPDTEDPEGFLPN